MIPNPPFADIVHMGRTDPKSFGDSDASTFCGTDQSNRLCGKLGSPVVAATLNDPAPASHRVSYIVGLRAPTKMAGVAARRIVAAMERIMFQCRAISARCEQGDVRRRSGNACNLNKPVLALITVCTPLPTFVWPKFIHLAPKSRFIAGGNVFKLKGSHSVVPHVVGQGRALLAQCFRPVFSSRMMICSQAEVA